MASTKPAKTMDVSHPGKTPPAENSRSVIISNHTPVQDPMVKDASAEEPAKPITTVSHQKTIQPLSVPEPAEKPVEEEPVVKPVEDETPSPEPVEQETPTSTAVEPVKDDTPDLDGDKGAVSPEAEQAARESEAEEQSEAIQKLIDTKRYYLPITSSEQRRSKRTLIIGVFVSVLLVGAWFIVALDAGIIHIDGLQPYTHFFSN